MPAAKSQAISFRDTLAPLAIRDFRFLLTSNFLWWQARWMEAIVTGWLVLELTNSAWQVALMGFYRSIPMLFVGIFAGPLIDRFGRRPCARAAQTGNFLISAVVVLLLWSDRLEVWHLAVAALLMGTVWSLDWPARRSLIPDLVGKEHTVDAMILENVAQNVSRIFGPFASGAFIAAFGAVGSYALLTGISALALLALLGMTDRPLPQNALPSSSPWTQMREGLQYAQRSQPIMGVMLMTLIMNMLAFPYLDLLPIFARDVLMQGPLGLGVLGASVGVGSVVGLFALQRLRTVFSNGWLFLGGSLMLCLLLIAFAASTSFVLSLILLACVGLGRACFGVMQSSIMLLAASDEMRSRAMGSLTLFIGIGPLGRLKIGALAENFGAPMAVTLQSSMAALAVIWVMWAFPDLRRQGMPAARGALQPSRGGAPAD
jgi:MFS family permease